MTKQTIPNIINFIMHRRSVSEFFYIVLETATHLDIDQCPYVQFFGFVSEETKRIYDFRVNYFAQWDIVASEDRM